MEEVEFKNKRSDRPKADEEWVVDRDRKSCKSSYQIRGLFKAFETKLTIQMGMTISVATRCHRHHTIGRRV
jgi:hypothetical protein